MEITLDTIYNMDCLEGMRMIPDGTVDCCVTSPPYFTLRDYGTEGQIGLEQSPEEYIDRLTDVFREVLRQPFLQDGKVCATDGHVLIRIDAAMCDGDYQEKPNGLTPPRTASVIPEADRDETLSRQELSRALEKAPGEESRQCPECKGEGQVEWEYRDRLCNHHHHLDTCPECDGTGEISAYTAAKYHFTLHGCSLCYRHLQLLLRTMEYLQTDTLQLRHATLPQVVLLAAPGIEIIAMPQMRDNGLEEIKIK